MKTKQRSREIGARYGSADRARPSRPRSLVSEVILGSEMPELVLAQASSLSHRPSRCPRLTRSRGRSLFRWYFDPSSMARTDRSSLASGERG